MKFSITVLGICLMTTAAAAQAHAHLAKSMPAEGAVLTDAPATVVLYFSEAARMTSITLQKDQEPAHKLTLPAGAAAAQIDVAIPTLAPGMYTLAWRVLSDDSHVAGGTLHFTVAAPAK